jgi:hypothetical protein
MKLFFILSLLALAASNAFAGRCVPDRNNEMNFENRCDVLVTGTTLAECHITGGTRFPDDRGHYPRHFPGNYNPPYHTHPWDRSAPTTKASACDVTLDDCKYFAFRQLDKFRYTNNCGDLSVGKSVDYKFQTLNADGTISHEVTGRMRK